MPLPPPAQPIHGRVDWSAKYGANRWHMEKLPEPVYISHEMVTNTRQFYIVLYTCKFKRSSMVETFLKAFF